MNRRITPVVFICGLIAASALAVHFQTEAAQARRLPNQYTLQKALLGNGLVLEIKNESFSILPVKITLTNVTVKSPNDSFITTTKVHQIIDARHILQLGPNQKVQISSGDEVVIQSQGFAALKFQATL